MSPSSSGVPIRRHRTATNVRAGKARLSVVSGDYLSGNSRYGLAPAVRTVIDGVNAVFAGGVDHGRLTREQVEAVRDAARMNDGWSLAKRGGLDALPGGQLSERARDLVEQLARVSIFVVPVGELERWVPEIGGTGPVERSSDPFDE